MNATPQATGFAPAEVVWREDGTAVSPKFGDVFHSASGAAAQARYVFIQGNDLPARWQRGEATRIAELGFGSGLNFLLSAQLFLDHAPATATLYYLGLELHPWTRTDAERLLHDAPIAAQLKSQWLDALNALVVGPNRIILAQGRIQLTLIVAEAQLSLKQASFPVECWFLDGFGPRYNPEMWQPELLQTIASQLQPGGTLATWCCAGPVRRELEAAGLHIAKQPGFGRKREMLVAHKPGLSQPLRVSRLKVIGGGLAGAWTARLAAERGLEVQLVDAAKAPATGASCMPMLMVRPYARHRDTPTGRFFWQAAAFSVSRLNAWQPPGWQACAIWREFGEEVPHWLEPAGWHDGPKLCQFLLEHPRIQCEWQRSIPPQLHKLSASEAQVWATAVPPQPVQPGPQGASLVRAIRGQQSLWQSGALQLGQHNPRVGHCVGVETPLGLYFGASQGFDDLGLDHRPHEALTYGARLPKPPQESDLAQMQHWTGTRRQSRDRLPLVGPCPDIHLQPQPGLAAGRAHQTDLPVIEGHWLNVAHGARTATSAGLAASLLLDRIMGTPWACLADEAFALDPRRFWLRAWRRGEWERSMQP
nr:tRNA (5-methylaminomethyl-2-thiouridine)(34)-methyltransferase MnmD [Oceanococcus sp. HetDA_MAG_MS8]